MNAAAWINLDRSVFNAVKIWVDPEYEKERDLIIQDFHQNVVKPFGKATTVLHNQRKC
jgi:hypothetical protein